MIRPPVAARRLRVVDDETLVFRLKTPWADGTTSLVLSPTELIEKLAALVPPPRTHLIRYHGVLAEAVEGDRRLERRVLHVPEVGHLVFHLKAPWADGTTSLVLSPTELIEKLAALVPPPYPPTSPGA